MRFVLALCAVGCLSGVLLAQAPVTVFLDLLTWTEVRDAVAAGSTTMIIPTGGTEQNGPHMVLGQHNYLPDAEMPGDAGRRLDADGIALGHRDQGQQRSNEGRHRDLLPGSRQEIGSGFGTPSGA